LRAIGLSVDGAQASIRFSLGRFTSPSDIERALSLIEQAL
jgi:cysteine sulfinate desulfinase/cysteine desulfurase-like protein